MYTNGYDGNIDDTGEEEEDDKKDKVEVFIIFQAFWEYR